MKLFKTLIIFVCTAVSTAAFAQGGRYEPTTNWPYVYEEFQPAWITTTLGSRIEYDDLNINVVNGKAHYVKNGVIMEADMSNIALLTIGNENYVRAAGALVKVIRNTEHSAVVRSIQVDTDAMSRSNIGYGTSSTANTQNVSLGALNVSLDAVTLNRSLDDLNKQRDTGETLALKEIDGILYKGSFIPAARSAVLNIYGIDKDAVKKFIKENKIKFSKTEDLAKLVDYLYSF